MAHPEFARNRFVYLTYTRALDRGQTVVPVRGRLEGTELASVQNIFVAFPAGKLLRLNDDGSSTEDNPFVGRADTLPEIYSLGHRNQQGLALHPVTGQPFATEHGVQDGDELNAIKPGGNYGWPLVTYGRHYSGRRIVARVWREDLNEAVDH